MSGVVTLGETMGLFAAGGQGTAGDQFRLRIGGAESNVAIGLVRLGVPATWIGRVGADVAGDLITRELRAEGVQARSIVDASAPTGLMVKTRPYGSVTRVDYHRRGSAGSLLRSVDVDADLVRAADLLHITGITPALSASASAAVDYAVEVAVEAGIRISFDVNHRARLWADASYRDVYRRLAARADVLFAGDDEAGLLVSGLTPESLARGLADLGPAQVVIKRGAAGCVALIDGKLFEVPAIPVTAVDTVGAGDAFAAGYLAELLAGLAPAERLATATRAGAFACLGHGDWESLPGRADLELTGNGDPVVR